MSAKPSAPPLRHRLILLLVALATVAAVSIPSGSPAWAGTGSSVVGSASGRCLDVKGNASAPGTGVGIWTCSRQDNQAWTLTSLGELRVYNGAMCLDVAGHDRTAPARVQIWTCHGGANQRWRVGADGAIIGVESGMCLDVTRKLTSNGTPVQLWTCSRQGNQQWWIGSSPERNPPTVPGNPRVSGLTCNTVTFSWNASIDDTGVAFYDVYHDGQQMKSVSATTLSTNLTVVAGATWGLYVNARDAAGNVSQASTTVPITPPQCHVDSTPPTAPSALTGTASGTSVRLSWGAATDDVSVRAYEVYRGKVKVGSVTSPTTNLVDSGLTAATAYTYYVVARDGQNNVSPRSNPVTVTTGSACSNPICAVTQVSTDTDIPWGLVTLSDGTILYSRRDAHDIVRLNPATGAKTTVGTVPNVVSTEGEGGLLGLAVSASFPTDHWLYVMHTSPTDNRIVRIKVANNSLDLGTEQILVAGIQRNKYHDGGRLRFGPDGKLYASTGDAQNGNSAQDRSGLNGKVLRLNPDGSTPADNPFGNLVWSYGHRNPQGLAFDSQGRLWEQEFGNGVMDETNLIARGGNYGWPACEGTSGSCSNPGFIAPKRTYPTSEGSCSGITIVRDVLYVACGRGTRLYREVIDGASLTNVQVYYNGTYGRLRTVEPAPGNSLWLTTTNLGDKDSVPNNSNEKILRVSLGG